MPTHWQSSRTLPLITEMIASSLARPRRFSSMRAPKKDEQTWWTADETGVYSTGTSASVETTGLAAQALLKWGQASGTARKALSYIASKKDASGTWGSTQATIMALRASLLASEKGTADLRGTVEIAIN